MSENNFTQLYWKTDADKIKELLSSVNTKYLVGRFNKSLHGEYDKDVFGKKHHIVVINWKEYTFNCSRKTIREELDKRFFEQHDPNLGAYHTRKCDLRYYYISNNKNKK